jgi:hypothetical protein
MKMRASFLLLACLPLLSLAQSWEYEAPVQPQGNGYHNIYLPAALTCRLSDAGGNIRLLDSSAHEIPYILSETKLVEEEASIVWMPHYEDDYWAHWYSRSYFQNTQKLKLDRLAIKIRNADVHQDFWLSGSDDMHRWYIIKEDYDYDAHYDPQSTWNLLTIHFPPTDYRYYKIEIRHHWREPIQIMDAGYYAFAEKQGHSQPVPDPVISQRENGSQSVVDIRFDGPHYLDQVLMEVDGPELYLRNATLQKKDVGGSFENVRQFQLSSKALNQLQLERERGTEWRLLIENKDDKPIRIAGVQARQRQQYLTAKLEGKGAYKLVVGEEGLRAPEYDLAFFKNDLPKVRPSATVGAVKGLLQPVATGADANGGGDSLSGGTVQPLVGSGGAGASAGGVEGDKPIYQRPVFLWAGIGLIVLLVGGMSLKLLKDMKKDEEAED